MLDAMNAKQTVIVLGASEKPDRYSNQAVRLLIETGHDVIPVNPKGGVIEGLEVLRNLEQVEKRVDTLSVYVSPAVSAALRDSILRIKPGRVVFNPGAENADLRKVLNENGIETEEACTLVLLRTGQF